MSHENPWTYLEQPFDSDSIGDNFGFVYKITNLLNGRSYIGRKYFWSFRTPPGKKRKQKQESDWKAYYGSCPELKEDIKRFPIEFSLKEKFFLYIKQKELVTFEETKQLFLNNVLSEALDNGAPAFYNSNILGRYMRKDYGNFGRNTLEDT